MVKKITFCSPKKTNDLLNTIKSSTDPFHIIYLKRPSKWVSTINGSNIMIGRYYYFTGVVKCLYATVIPQEAGCIIRGEIKMPKGNKVILTLLLAMAWLFPIYVIAVNYRYVDIHQIINMLLSNFLFYVPLGFSLIIIIWNCIINHGEIDYELLEFIKKLL